MKIAVVGAGAMGSVYAGLLAEGGNEVWAVDVDKAHIDAIRNKGLHLEGKSGDRVIPMNATIDAKDVGPCDLVVIATKARHVDAAARSAVPLLGTDTMIVTIQNGLGAAERIARSIDPRNVVIGVAGGFGASVRGPGHVHHNGMELIRLGEMTGPVTPRLEKIAKVWNDAGFRVKAFDDIDQLVWEKFVCNVTYSGTAGLTDLTLGQIMADENAWSVASACGMEAYTVGRAKGVNFSFDDPIAYIRAFGGTIPNGKPSLLLDLLEGRPCEIDFINGGVCR